ncbi:MAG: permease [Candidatus Aenigmarchaeota archaeon]|nr:permease [Candidatus Aenigmarchaeota archaeon]
MEELIASVLSVLTGLDASSRASEVISFFIADSIKILALLFAMIFVMGVVRTYIPPERVRKSLENRGAGGYLIASSFGALTPFCSCSSIPLFLTLARSGAPIGMSFAFLVTSPIVNEYLVVLMLAFFGPVITVLYVLSGIAIGIISGFAIEKLGLEKHMLKDVRSCSCSCRKKPAKNDMEYRLRFGLSEATGIIRKLWLWVLLGVGIGAIIHNYIPQEAFEAAIGFFGPLDVPVAVLLGVPMYGNCAAIVPIAVALFNKGIPLGTTLAFMMSTSALSLPEAIILKKAMKTKLIVLFFTIVAMTIIFTGFAFNVLEAFIL